MLRRLILMFLMFLMFVTTATTATAELTLDEVKTAPQEVIEEQLPDAHPVLYYVYAARLFGTGERETAVLWFYVGQLRFRFHLTANPELPPDGDPALLASLNSSLGRTFNEYIGADPDVWAATVEKALQWDASHRNGFTSKEDHADALAEIRTGLESLRDMIRDNRETIRAERAKNGLPTS